MRGLGLLKLLGRLGDLAQLAPSAEPPFFFSQIGRTFPAGGRAHATAWRSWPGCIANVCFARLNEATVRVLQKNGCEVVVPDGQGCCGALHVHSGLRDEARKLARRNIDAVLDGGFDAIITNAAGCGSTLKEYGELLEDDPEYAAKAREFAGRMRDVTEFLAAHRAEPRHGPGERRRDLPGFLPPGARPAHPHRAAQAAGRDSRPDVPRDAAAPTSAAAAPASTTWSRTRCRCRFWRSKMEAVNATGAEHHRHRQPRLHAAASGRRAAARQRPARDARGGVAGPGVQER